MGIQAEKAEPNDTRHGCAVSSDSNLTALPSFHVGKSAINKQFLWNGEGGEESPSWEKSTKTHPDSDLAPGSKLIYFSPEQGLTHRALPARMPTVTMLYFSFGNKSSFPVFQVSLSNHVLGTLFDHSSEILTCLKNTVDGFSRNANLDLKTMFDLKWVCFLCPLTCAKYTTVSGQISVCVWRGGTGKSISTYWWGGKCLKGFIPVWSFTDVIGNS